MKRGIKGRPQRRRRRALAPLAAAALVVVAVAERVRRWRRDDAREASMYGLELNKSISRRLIMEAFDAGRLEVVDELVAPSFVSHDPAGGDFTGPEGTKDFVTTYRQAFPDLRVTIEEQVAERDLVATRWAARGTHRGDLMGLPATGKEVTITGLTLDRIENGKLAESWNNWDALGLMQQLGAIPALTDA